MFLIAITITHMGGERCSDRLTLRHSDTARYTGIGGRDIIDRQTDRLTVTHRDTDR